MHNVRFLAISAGQAKKYAIAVTWKPFSYIFCKASIVKIKSKLLRASNLLEKVTSLEF